MGLRAKLTMLNYSVLPNTNCMFLAATFFNAPETVPGGVVGAVIQQEIDGLRAVRPDGSVQNRATVDPNSEVHIPAVFLQSLRPK